MMLKPAGLSPAVGALWEAAVTRPCGFVANIEPEPTALRHFSAIRAQLVDVACFASTDISDDFMDAYGCGPTITDAAQSCLGEAIERYGSMIWSASHDIVWDTARNLEMVELVEALEPLSQENIQSLAGARARIRPWTPDLRLSWTEGQRASDRSKVWIPVQVCAPSYGLGMAEPQLGIVSNKGLAAGESRASALLHAVLEVVEADSLMCRFALGAQPREIYLDPSDMADWYGMLDQSSLIRAWDFSLDVGPASILAALESVEGWRKVYNFGMACEPSPERALDRAVAEAVHGSAWVTLDNWRADTRPYHQIRSRREAKLLGASNAYQRDIGWLLDTRPSIELSALRRLGEARSATYEDVLSDLTQHGLDVIEVDMTPSDIHLATGYRVVRALVPGLYGYQFGTPITWSRSRLRQAAAYYGLSQASLSLTPHPCP